MASHFLLLRGKRKIKTLYVRFKHRDKVDTLISTKFKIHENHWNKSSQSLKRDSNDAELMALRSDIADIHTNLTKLEEYLHRGKLIYSRELVQKAIKGDVSEEEKQTITIVDAIEKYKQHLIRGNETKSRRVSQGAIRNYNTTKSRLERFTTHKKHFYNLSQLDFNFRDDYAYYASAILKLAPNSIAKDFKQIKTVCTFLKDHNFEVHDKVFSRKFRSETENTSFITFTEEELRTLMKFDGAESLKNARDWLIIGCCTACRVGDLMKLSERNLSIEQDTGLKIITYTQNKTGQQVTMPVHPFIEEILSNKNEHFPRPISPGKFNLHIKQLCKKVGFTKIVKGSMRNEETGRWEEGEYEKWKLVKSHICRRTFATINYEIITNKKFLLALTGHSTERMLMNYVGVTESDHLKDVSDAWKKYN